MQRALGCTCIPGRVPEACKTHVGTIAYMSPERLDNVFAAFRSSFVLFIQDILISVHWKALRIALHDSVVTEQFVCVQASKLAGISPRNSRTISLTAISFFARSTWPDRVGVEKVVELLPTALEGGRAQHRFDWCLHHIPQYWVSHHLIAWVRFLDRSSYFNLIGY